MIFWSEDNVLKIPRRVWPFYLEIDASYRNLFQAPSSPLCKRIQRDGAQCCWLLRECSGPPLSHPHPGRFVGGGPGGGQIPCGPAKRQRPQQPHCNDGHLEGQSRCFGIPTGKKGMKNFGGYKSRSSHEELLNSLVLKRYFLLESLKFLFLRELYLSIGSEIAGL